jgi:hypothetical protein
MKRLFCRVVNIFFKYSFNKSNSDILNSVNYSDYFKIEEVYRENIKIVDSGDLDVLRRQEVYNC